MTVVPKLQTSFTQRDYNMSDYRIGVITMPVFKAGVTPLSNLITIICSLSKNVLLITGGEGYDLFRNDKRLKTLRISHNTSTFIIKRMFNFIIPQFKISFYIFKTRNQIDIFIFFLGGDILLFPMLTACLFRKKVLILFPSSTIKIHTLNQDPLVFILKFLHRGTCTFADKLIVYAESLIGDYSLGRWAEKIVIAHDHYIDFDRFEIKNGYLSRECIVGYIGRLSTEKGVQHFVQALPAILKDRKELRILIGGDGPLKKNIETALQTEKLRDYVDLPGWVSNEDYPGYLNRLRLLVLPSYTEGLPYTILEAMTCGTPVLATPVGAIPDIIIDGKTGFIMKDNSPECIAENVKRALSSPDLEKIVKNGRRFVDENFTFEKTVGIWRSILRD